MGDYAIYPHTYAYYCIYLCNLYSNSFLLVLQLFNAILKIAH